jgi:hypothetical protein
MTIIEHRCGSTVYLAVARKGLSQLEALALLQKEANLVGATPTLDLLDGGTLGETDGPSLYVMKADLTPICRRCGSTTGINENGCCITCQLREAA